MINLFINFYLFIDKRYTNDKVIYPFASNSEKILLYSNVNKKDYLILQFQTLPTNNDLERFLPTFMAFHNFFFPKLFIPHTRSRFIHSLRPRLSFKTS